MHICMMCVCVQKGAQRLMIKTSSGERVDVLVADNRNKTAFGNILVRSRPALSPPPSRDHSDHPSIFSIYLSLAYAINSISILSIYSSMQVVCCEGNAGVSVSYNPICIFIPNATHAFLEDVPCKFI